MRITKEAILSTLPVVLAEDEAMLALAEPIAAALAERVPEIDLVRIYTRIDELPESLLDILAYDFHVEWWEYDATLEEKRAVMKKVWFVHRHKGTKSSVETAVGALFPGAEVSEWFDYEGEPYHFRMNVPIKEQQVLTSAQDYKTRVFFLVNYFKNLRSVLEEIFFTFETEIEKTLYPMSHLGRGLSVTNLPEWFPKWPEDVGLYVSGMMPRWQSLKILNDLTEIGLVVRATLNGGIAIIPYLPMLGNYPMRVWEGEQDQTLNIRCIGLSAAQQGYGLVITQQQDTETTVSGSLVHVTDALGGPVLSLLIGVKPTQSFNGYDHPWAAGKGKNLYNKEDGTKLFRYNPSTGKIAASSTANSVVIPCEPNTTYTVSKAIGSRFSVCYTKTVPATGVVCYGGIEDYSAPSITITTGDDAAYLVVYAWFKTDDEAVISKSDMLDTVQIEKNDHATPYEPYENICPLSGRTGANIVVSPTNQALVGSTYPVSWQSLAGSIYGGILDVTHGTLAVTHGMIASYDGETLPGEWISDRDAYEPGTSPTTGAQVVYELETPTIYNLSPVQVDLNFGTNYVWTDSGRIESLGYLSNTGIDIPESEEPVIEFE